MSSLFVYCRLFGFGNLSKATFNFRWNYSAYRPIFRPFYFSWRFINLFANIRHFSLFPPHILFSFSVFILSLSINVLLIDFKHYYLSTIIYIYIFHLHILSASFIFSCISIIFNTPVVVYIDISAFLIFFAFNIFSVVLLFYISFSFSYVREVLWS